MSDSEDFTVTYTEVSSPFEGLSDIGSLGVEGPPMMLEDPYTYVLAALQAPSLPDYMPGPEEPEQAPPLPDFVPELIYLKFMPLEYEILPAEEQPFPAADSPTADSPGYIPESDPEEDPADYPVERDDDDDKEDESYRDEADEDEDDDEEEEHPTLADSIPPLLVHHTTTRISILVQPPTPFWSEAKIDRFLTIPSPPPSLLSPWSSSLPQIPSPPLPESPPLPLKAETPYTSYPLPLSTPPLLPIPLPTSSPPLLLPSTSHRANIIKVTLLPQKRLCIALGLRYDVDESSSAAAARPTRGFTTDYGFASTLDNEIRHRRDHARTARLMEIEARLSRQAWVQSMDASDTVRTEVMSLRSIVLAQQSEIAGLWAADRIRQTQLAEALTLLRTLQTQMAALQRRQGPARDVIYGLVKMAPKRTTISTPAITTTTTTTVMDALLKALIEQGVANALAARDADRSQNDEDSCDSRMGVRRQDPPARECTYQDFMKCKPLYFKGTEGVVELTQWFERMEIVFRISNCTVENQIKFATCTLLGSALTWVGHLARDCSSAANANTANNQRGTRAVRNGNAPAKVYAVGHAGTNPDSNVVTGTFLLNNRYVSILFDTGADRSFVSTAFSSRIDITPTSLDHYHDVKLANERIIGLNTILRGCTLNFLNHPFNIDLMLVELGSFDAIIGMDWLEKYQDVIVCAKKIKYMLEGCHVFLSHVTTKETEEKSEKKRLEDVSIVQDFPKVFLEDLLGLSPTRQVEFQIDLIPGAAPVA
nr:hypothetical protein [Tanacetum cinerariifolium]